MLNILSLPNNEWYIPKKVRSALYKSETLEYEIDRDPEMNKVSGKQSESL